MNGVKLRSNCFLAISVRDPTPAGGHSVLKRDMQFENGEVCATYQGDRMCNVIAAVSDVETVSGEMLKEHVSKSLTVQIGVAPASRKG
jgi:hypothetical protein